MHVVHCTVHTFVLFVCTVHTYEFTWSKCMQVWKAWQYRLTLLTPAIKFNIRFDICMYYPLKIQCSKKYSNSTLILAQWQNCTYWGSILNISPVSKSIRDLHISISAQYWTSIEDTVPTQYPNIPMTHYNIEKYWCLILILSRYRLPNLGTYVHVA